MNLHVELHGPYTSAMSELQVVFFSCSSRSAGHLGSSPGIEKPGHEEFFWSIVFLRLVATTSMSPVNGGELVGVIWTRSQHADEIDSIAIVLKRQRSLLEQVLD